MDHHVLCHLTGKSKMWPVSTWADPNPPCVPPPTLPGLGSRVPLSCGDKSRYSFDPRLQVCVCQSVSPCRPWPGWRVMSGLVTNGVARDVTTCHAVTSRHVTRPRDTPLSDCVGRREMAARPWQ